MQISGGDLSTKNARKLFSRLENRFSWLGNIFSRLENNKPRRENSCPAAFPPFYAELL